MSGQEINEKGRNHDRPATGTGLGLLDVSDAARDLLERADDANLTLQEIEAIALQPYELSPAAAEIDGAVDQCPELRIGSFGELFDLRRSQETLLGLGTRGSVTFRQGDSTISRESAASLRMLRRIR